MATTPAAVDGIYGISTTLAGFTIESENITESPQKELVPDQANAVANEITYDTRYELRLTVRGASAPVVSDAFGYAGKKWSVDSVEKAGTYNGLQRYNITAHRYTNWPAQAAQ